MHRIEGSALGLDTVKSVRVAISGPEKRRVGWPAAGLTEARNIGEKGGGEGEGCAPHIFSPDPSVQVLTFLFIVHTFSSNFTVPVYVLSSCTVVFSLLFRNCEQAFKKLERMYPINLSLFCLFGTIQALFSWSTFLHLSIAVWR